MHSNQPFFILPWHMTVSMSTKEGARGENSRNNTLTRFGCDINKSGQSNQPIGPVMKRIDSLPAICADKPSCRSRGSNHLWNTGYRGWSCSELAEAGGFGLCKSNVSSCSIQVPSHQVSKRSISKAGKIFFGVVKPEICHGLLWRSTVPSSTALSHSITKSAWSRSIYTRQARS